MIELISRPAATLPIGIAEASLLLGVCYLITTMLMRISPSRTRGSWPIKEDPLGGPAFRLLLLLLDQLKIMALNDSSYALFCDFRSGLFSNRHLGDDAQVNAGPKVDTNAKLSPQDLQDHLAQFSKQAPSSSCYKDQWFHDPRIKLCGFLFHNEEAFEKRLSIIRQATSTIWITTWALEDSTTATRLAEALLERAQAGVDIRIMVDGVYEEYLGHRETLSKRNYTKTLYMLAQSGISVRRIETWFHAENNDLKHDNNSKDAYVVGSHRKLMLVDNRILVTGGRNISDEYFKSTQFHFRDAEVVLEGANLSKTTGALLTSLWARAKVLKGTGNVASWTTEKHEQSTAIPASMDANPATELVGESLRDTTTTTPCAPVLDQPVSLFQLEHNAGNPKGHDIIYTTLLFLIETAESRIDLFCGYFQLFPDLDQALSRAVARGVDIRLVTNSSETTDLAFFNKVTRQALERLLELGVEIQAGAAPSSSDSAPDCCLHYKMILVDQKALMIGSWNCVGTSIFHDDEFSVVLFDTSTGAACLPHLMENHLIAPLQREGRLEPLTSLAKDAFALPGLYTTFGSENGIRQMNRGF